MAIIKKSANNKCWIECGEKGTFCWWECKLVQSQWRTVWRFLKKQRKNYHMIQQPHPGIYPEKNMAQKDASTSVFIAVLFTIARHGSNLNVFWRCTNRESANVSEVGLPVTGICYLSHIYPGDFPPISLWAPGILGHLLWHPGTGVTDAISDKSSEWYRWHIN